MKTKSNTTIKYHEIYYLCLFLWSFSFSLINCTNIFSSTRLYSMCWILIRMYLLSKMILDFFSNNKRGILVIPLVMGIAVISHYYSESEFLFPLMYFLAAGKNIEPRRCVKSMLFGHSLAFIITIALYYMGMVSDTLMIRHGSRQLRYSFGFDHPNTFGILAIQICLMIFCLYGSSREIYTYILYLIFFRMTYYVANSRSSAMILLMLIVIQIIYRIFVYRNTLISRFVFWLFSLQRFLVPLILVICVFIASGKISLNVTGTLQARVGQASNYFHYYKVKLWGQHLIVNYTSRYLFTLDNSYIYLLVGMGMIVSLCFLICYLMVLRKAVRNRNYPVFLIFILYAIWGIVETSLIRFNFNFSLIYFLWLLWPNRAVFRRPVKPVQKIVNQVQNVMQTENDILEEKVTSENLLQVQTILTAESLD